MSKKGGSLELNKIAASIFLAGLLAMTVSKIIDNAYSPEEKPEKFGYAVEAIEQTSTSAAKVEEEIDIAALLEHCSADRGAEIFKKKCASCHSVEKGAPHAAGPALWGIMGQGIGKQAGYNYSTVLAEHPEAWTDENMYKWLKKPKKFAKGTKMSFFGIKKPEEIADVIFYLKQQSD